MEAERRYFIHGLLKEFRRFGGGRGEVENAPSPWESFAAGVSLIFWGKRALLESNVLYFDRLIAEALKSYAVADHHPPVPRAPYSHVMAGVSTPLRLRDVADGETNMALLMTALALNAFHAERGEYPGSLDELVSAGLLTAVPCDPFSADGMAPLRYRIAENGAAYLLYSVGPDGRDDGGTPIDNPGATHERPRRVAHADSRGDIVAGVNAR
jgi:hypothetical protein